MKEETLRIGTRGSALALWQARHVEELLRGAAPEPSSPPRIELSIIKTSGDRILDVPLAKVGGKGLFVKEIEEAMLRREIDLAVHSMKDLPTGLPEGLCLAAVLPREDPHDVLCSPGGGGLAGLPKRARVGTSSLRRACQLRAARPDLLLEALRGNVDTRLRRLDEGRFDAVVLAAAGLLRLGHGPRISQRLPFEVCLPAIGQGAIGIEARADDLALLGRLACLHHAPTAAAVTAERAFLARLGGGCQTPIAAHAVLVAREAGLGEGAGKGEGGRLRLAAMVGQPDGSQLLRGEREAAMAEAAAMGEALADELIGRGADRILRETEAAAAAAPAGTAVF